MWMVQASLDFSNQFFGYVQSPFRTSHYEFTQHVNGTTVNSNTGLSK